jgi:hypothetical protein
MGDCSSNNCNPCGPDYNAINQLATKTAAYARQANTYAVDAANSAQNAQNSFLEFNALYLGSFAVAPAVDNEGNPLQEGALYFNSVSNQMFVWQGTSWIDFDFDEFTPFLATGTTFARNLVTREADVANVLDFGADPTGVVDSKPAILLAIATNKNVFFPKGTYKFVVTTTNAVTPSAKSTLFGMGAEIKFETTNTASFFNIFNLNQGDVTIRDLKLTWTTPSTSAGGIGLFSFNAGNNYTIDNIVAYLDTQEIAGVRNAPNHLFMINANCSDVYISNSKFTRSAFGIVKTNASTAINKNWEFNSNIFEDFFASQLNFNTPNGDWDNVRVINNEIRNSLAYTLGPSAFIHFGGLAGGPSSGRFVWANNTFTGTGQGLHFEEGAEEVIIDGNTFATTDIAIQILDNTVSGSVLTPKKFIISNNTIVQTGTKVKLIENRGIDLIWDGSGAPAVNDIVITGNVIDNWEVGIYSAEEPEKYIINSNLIASCGVGIQANFGNANISRNTIRECPVGISSGGGLLGSNYFVKCTKEYDYNSTEGIGSTGFELFRSYTIATGTNSYKIIDLPIRFNGKLVFSIDANGARRFCVYDIQYDGTTFTGGTALITGGSGNFSAPVISVTTTQLQFTTNNTSGSSQVSNVKISFEGGLYYK